MYHLRRIPAGVGRYRASRLFLFGSATAATATYSSSTPVAFLERGASDAQDDPSSKDGGKSTSPSAPSSEEPLKKPEFTFFSSDQWEQLRREGEEKTRDFWNRILSDDNSSSTNQQVERSPKTSRDTETKADFSDLAGSFLQLFGGSKDQQQEAISTIVAKARETASKSDISEEVSFVDLLEALSKYSELIENVAEKYISSIDFKKFEPTALFYYLEYEDERKNPSWKRRQHRFFDGVDMRKVEELNNYLELARVSYADSVDEITEGLEGRTRPCELIYAEVESRPGQPANFVAIPRDQPRFADYLEVIIAVRGTKSLADAITDLICEDVEYRGGRAHSFIVQSGKYLVEKHTTMLQELLRNSGKSKLKLKLVGHSLGAGAASIAGMEFQHNAQFDVQVVGFGCPALVSQDLAGKADYITTVVNDSDVVPRMSGRSVANLLIDVMEFDWFPYAERDAQEAIDALHKIQPLIFNRDMLLRLKETIKPRIETYAQSLISEKTAERNDVELFPPGKCLHIYRDGVGFSASFVPNTFFSEIDVTRRMVDDHVFHRGYSQTFLELMRQHSGDHHFRFGEDINLDAR